MKFFLDENVNYGSLAPLRAVYAEHEFRHAYDEGFSGVEDIPLFGRLGEQSYDAIITKDRNQLSDSEERRALFDAGLHWIGHRAKDHKGLKAVSIETATVTAGLIYVLNDLRPEPHSYLLKGIPSEQSQRVKVQAVGLAGWGRPRRSGLGIA
ncbi:hypothetical protein [Gordonia sp. (in: high G+C Gram-positive bacteria)]|uniref:PIN-like domain-containing protein n=1 Tax=Gordonia sp. (in: high G+C Gram-positive bacteria) TaxID=84139 RepID=UPI0039E46030